MKDADIAAFREYLLQSQEMFKAWGEFVTATVQDGIKAAMGEEASMNFLRIAPVPRVKSVESAIGKIARKGYKDPMQQMTDLIGVRFVVLLQEQMDLVSNLIKKETRWVFEQARDPVSEMHQNPKLFDYQSVHFVIRSAAEFSVAGHTVLKGLTCEIQVRTLLQHAYAEMVHDSIYKPVGPVPPKAERLVARSMALMETTDDLFTDTMALLAEENKPRNDFLASLAALYGSAVGRQPAQRNEDINLAVLDAYRSLFTGNELERIQLLVSDKKWIVANLMQRADNVFFQQPVSLLAYLLANDGPIEQIMNSWPLPGAFEELELIFSDLGISVH